MAKMTLEMLVTQLQGAYGSALTGVVLYGSAARHHAPPGASLDVLVLVSELTEAAMRPAGAATRAWVEAGHPAPMVLTEAEWRASADIFAIEYADILAAHKVVHGMLPLDGIAVTRANLRLQLEREAMGKLLQLRRELQMRGDDKVAMRDLLHGVRGPSFALLRALLRTADGATSPHNDSLDVAREVATLTGIDTAPFAALVEHQHGTKKIPDAEALGVLRGVHDALQQLAAWIDTVP